MTYNDVLKKMDNDYFGKDLLIALSTIALETSPEGNARPCVRIVDAAYIDGAFYVCGYKLAGKFAQIENNPEFCATLLTFELDQNFVAHGYGENLGWVRDEKNAEIMVKVCDALKWFNIENENDPNSCLLKLTITHAYWNNPHGGYRNEIDFVNKTASFPFSLASAEFPYDLPLPLKDGDWTYWHFEAGSLAKVKKIVVEFDGNIPSEGYSFVINNPSWNQFDAGHAKITVELNKLLFDMCGLEGNILGFALWNEGLHLHVKRVYLEE